MIVRELVTKLGFDADTPEVKKYDDVLKKVRNTAFLVSGAIVAATGAVAAFTRSMANQGNQVAKTSVEVGMAIGDYQKLQFAVGQIANVAAPQLDMALRQANETMAKARVEGGRYSDSLKAIGFSQEEINSGTIKTIDVFRRLSAASQNTATSAKATAAASDILGARVARQLIPALQKSGAEVDDLFNRFEELGGGFTDAGAKASEDLVDTFSELSTIFNSLKIAIAEELIPVVRDILKQFIDWVVLNKEIIRENLLGFVRNMISVFRVFWSTVLAIARAVYEWRSALRVLAIAFVALKIFAFVKMLMSLVAASGSVKAAFLGLSSLFRIGLFASFKKIIMIVGRVITVKIALALAIAALLDDIWAWVSGSESAIGRVLGPWLDFKNNVVQFSKDIYQALLNMIPESVISFFNKIGKFVGGGVFRMVNGENDFERQQRMQSQMTSDQQMGERRVSRSVSIESKATLEVPQGTSSEQQAALRSQADGYIKDAWEREIRRSLTDFAIV